MGRFKYNLSDHKTRKTHVKEVRLAFAERMGAERALAETFDPEAAKPTDNPFPEALKDEAPVEEIPEAPAEEAAAEEEPAAPVRKCGACGEPGHTKRTCPTLAAEKADKAGVSESDGGDDAATEQA